MKQMHYPEAIATVRAKLGDEIADAIDRHVRAVRHNESVLDMQLHEAKQSADRWCAKWRDETDALSRDVLRLHEVCRENVISARIILAANKDGRTSEIGRDAQFILTRTEAVLPPR